MTRERVVIDTNVFVSGLLSSTSPPSRAVERAATEDQLVASMATLHELTATLLSPRFDRYVSGKRRDALLLRLAPLVEIVEVVQQVRACRGPDDDKFLEAALAGRADLIITGDADLLVLHPFRQIAILSPTAYLDRSR